MKLYYSMKSKNGRKNRAQYDTLFFLQLFTVYKYQEVKAESV